MLAPALLLLLASATPLVEDIDFIEGKRLVDELDYERAVFRFQKLTKAADRPADERAQAFAWLGLTYANLGDEEQAIRAFVDAIRLDPLVALPPSSPKVAQTFDKARKVVREEVKADKDGDGVVDGNDRCVDQPETKNGHQDEDGCPDVVTVVVAPKDQDGDGVVDGDDACPTVAGSAAHQGCVPPPPEAKGAPVLLIGGGAAAGLGVVGVGAGAVFGVLAQGRQDDALAASFQNERASAKADADGFATIANVAYVAGGALVVVGASLMVVSLVGGEG